MHDIGQNIRAEQYGAIFARHVLEHSAAPLYVLTCLRECLRPDGLIYVEVPLPGTPTQQEANPNHYTCLTKKGWAYTLMRAGFTAIEGGPITFELEHYGKEEYLWLIARNSITSASPVTVSAGA
jgi:2-polyprenyl-3-methyl-5-hydroxy-6-metoxy-1,4-benzoquinol methylase